MLNKIMQNHINLNQAKVFIQNLAKTMNRRELAVFLRSFAEKSGINNFKNQASKELMSMIKPSDIVPDIYAAYKKIVHDGILFILSNLSTDRLMEIIVDQLLIKDDISSQERLVKTAQKIPTMHKLGQIIARNSNIDAKAKKWLINLENGIHGTDISDIKQIVYEEITNYISPFAIELDDKILAEASVGAVVSFTWTAPDTDKKEKGAFKVLKPGIKQKLNEEFKLLDKLAYFFNKNRNNYPLKDIRFIEIFKDIKDALKEEINLSGEQKHLKQAACFYENDNKVQIPNVLPFSGENITAMELIPGGKITDVHMSLKQRTQCCCFLFHALICQPLFSKKTNSIFHGDPHAGNIYAVKNKSGDIIPVLLDWNLAGVLSKTQRIKIIQLVCTIILEDKVLIVNSLKALAKKDCVDENFEKIIHEIMQSKEYAQSGFLKKTFYFIDQAAIKGILFPQNLLLFRKAFFTLEGVLHDINSDFNINTYMLKFFEGIFIKELPKRWAYSMIPKMDYSENYNSLISNKNLQLFFFRLCIENMKKGICLFSELMVENIEYLFISTLYNLNKRVVKNYFVEI